MLRMVMLPAAYAVLVVVECAAVVLAFWDEWFAMASGGVFVVGAVPPWSMPVFTAFAGLVSLGNALWRVMRRMAFFYRALPNKAGLAVVFGTAMFTLSLVSVAGLCSEMGGCGLNMEVLLVLLGISFSLLCGESMRGMPRSGLWWILGGGSTMVVSWIWFSLMEPDYVAMFADAGTVVVVMGAVMLAASFGGLRGVGSVFRP